MYQDAYAKLFAQKLILIKISGSLVDEDNFLDTLAQEIHTLVKNNVRILLIYGGGKQISQIISNDTMNDGVRVTEKSDIIKIKKCVHCLGKKIQEHFLTHNCGANLVDGNLFFAKPKGAEWKSTGIPNALNTQAWEESKQESINLLSCIAPDENQEEFNVNGDDMVQFLSQNLPVSKVILYSQTPVLDQEQEIISILTPKINTQLIHDGIINGGMQQKTNQVLKLLDSGIESIQLLGKDQSLCEELFTVSGRGTMFMPNIEDYVQLTNGTAYNREFILDFLTQFGQGHLRERSLAEITPSDYFMLEFDHFVGAMGELKPLNQDVIELGAFVTEGRMEGYGLGKFFLSQILDLSLLQKYKTLIALTDNPKAEQLFLDIGFSHPTPGNNSDYDERMKCSPGKTLFVKTLS